MPKNPMIQPPPDPLASQFMPIEDVFSTKRTRATAPAGASTAAPVDERFYYCTNSRSQLETWAMSKILSDSLAGVAQIEKEFDAGKPLTIDKLIGGSIPNMAESPNQGQAHIVPNVLPKNGVVARMT